MDRRPLPDLFTMFPNYSAHEAFFQPARQRSEVWRLFAGLGLGAVIFIGLQSAAITVLIALLDPDDLMTVQTEMALGNTQMGAVLMLGSFSLMIIAVAAVVHQLHKRNLLTLLGPWSLAAPQFLRVIWALAVLNLVVWILPPSETPGEVTQNVALADWLRFLPLAVPALLIQVSAEELLFRGYMQQQLAARFRNPLVWMGIPAILFGLLHYRADLPETTWLLMAWAALFGALAADLTARSGSLGPAIAMHLVTNASAILFVSSDDMLSGLSLYQMPVALDDPASLWPYLLIDLGMMLTSWLAARLALKC